ncbi:hypothetical protein V8E54_006593 [Elaphomyces granulatus]
MDPQEATKGCHLLSAPVNTEPQNPDNRGFLPQTHDMPEVVHQPPVDCMNLIAHSQVVHRPSVDLDKGPEITVSPPQDEEPIPPIQPMPSHYEPIFARRKQGKQEYWPSREGVNIDVAFSHYDKKTRAAFLTREAVRIFDLNLETLHVTTPAKRYTISDPLEKARITLSGRFLAVWGFCYQQKKKMFYFRDIEKEGDDLGNATSEDLGLLRSVAISPQGVVALVRQGDILIKKAQSIESNRSSGIPLKLYPDNGHVFAHAAFNDVGTLLFAWAYGKGVESLHVWKVGDSSLNRHSVARYPSEEREASDTKVIPYNTGMGCVVAASEQRVFPVRTPKKIDDETPLLRRQDIELKNLETGCVFQDCSFIALRRKRFWPRQKWFLREYQIEHRDTTDFLHKGPELCDLISKPGTSSQLRIIRVSQNPESKLVAVICNLDSIELVDFVRKYDNRTVYPDAPSLPTWNNERYESKLTNHTNSGYASAEHNQSEHMRGTGDLQSQNFMGSGYESAKNSASEDGQDPRDELSDTKTVSSHASCLPVWKNERYISELANPTDSEHTSAKYNKSEHMRSTGDPQSQIFVDSGYESARNNVSEDAQDPRDESDDTRTVYSDASSLPALNNECYISELVNNLSSNILFEQLDGTTLEQVLEVLPELLKAFALKVGHNASTQMHRDVMFFVHKHRR